MAKLDQLNALGCPRYGFFGQMIEREQSGPDKRGLWLIEQKQAALNTNASLSRKNRKVAKRA